MKSFLQKKSLIDEIIQMLFPYCALASDMLRYSEPTTLLVTVFFNLDFLVKLNAKGFSYLFFTISYRFPTKFLLFSCFFAL